MLETAQAASAELTSDHVSSLKMSVGGFLVVLNLSCFDVPVGFMN